MHIDELRDIVRRVGLAPATFGRRVVGDPRFVFDCENGRLPRPATLDRVTAFVEAWEAGNA